MPTNLPPDYYEVEKRYRAAESIPEKIVLLEEMMSKIPKHKGTDHLRADLRRKLSRLKTETPAATGKARQVSPYQIEREGVGQVVVIGHANSGKSAFVKALTNAEPEVSAASFSTWQPTPGMMLVENVQVQLIDTPPLNRDYVEPGLFDLLRRADLILLLVDLQTDPLHQIEHSLALLAEKHILPLYRLESSDSQAQERNFFIPLMVLVNKFDDPSYAEDYEICCELLDEDLPLLPISVQSGYNLDEMKQRVFAQLDVIRVYAKPPGAEPDFSRPFTLEKGNTVADFAAKVHQDFYENLKNARVWGSSAFDGQMVSRDYELQDGDIVELRI
ncbi:MAG: TGS domain-containing protein [Anaerolineales bacterium]|nr:TGS domain-containing protein [Anaerolineales bacterium]